MLVLKFLSNYHQDFRSSVCRFIPVIMLAPLLFIAPGCRNESPPQAVEPKTDNAESQFSGTIVAVGDSLTAGYGLDETEAYPYQLAKKLSQNGYRFKVINAGISGETSSGALSRIEWVVSALKPDIVILATGANDGLRGIDPQVLRNNLDDTVAVLKRSNIIVVLAGMKMLPNLGPAYISHLAKIYPAIARKHKIVLIPFFLEGVAAEARYNQSDGIHPNQEGYQRIVEHIYPYVVEAIEQYYKRGSSPD
jgi:acyl-CoA thioesterase-1